MTGGFSSVATSAASPLELHLDDAVDLDKGCYLGQEGVASVAKNPRGPPRTLYQVVFEDDFNLYDHQMSSDEEDDDDGDEGGRANVDLDNLTRVPRPGDVLYALGSNEEVAVGTLTSVAEPCGTGESVTVGLVLVRRSDSMLRQMKDRGLEIAERRRGVSEEEPVPHHSDPLDGLEVIVGGTFTVGTLRTLPHRRLPPGRCLFGDVEEVAEQRPVEADARDLPTVTSQRVELSGSSAAAPAVPAALVGSGAASDAPPPRVAPLRELSPSPEASVECDGDEGGPSQSADAEDRRKADKLEMLKRQAEEAMARRKQRQGKGSSSSG
jgi:hypothetical protein